MINSQPTLTHAQRAAVDALVERARILDHTSPLNEAAQLALAGTGSAEGSLRVRHWLDAVEDDLIGYAQLDLRDGSVQLVIDPAHRRLGHGRALAERVLASGPARTWWAFGDLPSARALARSLGLAVVRRLHIMTLDPHRIAAAEPMDPPAGVTIDNFRAGDLARLVAVNAAAFAGHPEQGALTAADFTARMAADWYHDDDLFVARDTGGTLIGFHWTKLLEFPDRTVGEVYVLGVDPGQAGRGTGRALLAAGIIHMRSRGASLIDLYVEAANERVVDMYRTAGFVVTHTDAAYGWVEED